MTTLCTTLHGSKLYRLDGPGSDTDVKSLHLPPVRDCLLLRATRNAQTKDGEGAAKHEHESFALQEWLKLAANGEDVTNAMLHCGEGDIIVDSPTWQYLRTNRKRFYTKEMWGAVGYAKSQCAKYALRADRMAAVEKVIAALEVAQAKGVMKVAQCWDDLPEGEHIERTINPSNRAEDKRLYSVAGKGIPATVAPDYALDILCRLRDSYGDRVRAARNLDGNDYKALSHSFRVGYQLLGIYLNGGFSYPLPQSDFIRSVKWGKLSYLDDHLDERLNELITEVERAAKQSAYPDRVDQGWLDQIVLDAYGVSQV